MLNHGAKRTTLAGAFVLTGLFSVIFTYRVMALKADAASDAYGASGPQSYTLISNAQFGTPQDVEKCQQLLSAQRM